MKRRRKVPGLLLFVVFAAVVGLSGYALSASGYTDSPFTQLALLSGQPGEGRFDRHINAGSGDPFAAPDAGGSAIGDDLTDVSTGAGSFQLPPVSDLSTDAPATLGDDAFRGEGPGDENAIDWSDVGDVLYDLWYVAATAVVFIVVQQIFRFIIRPFRSRRPVSAGAR